MQFHYKKFINFMNRPEQTNSGGEVSQIHEVRVDGISFCYPSLNQDQVPVIQDINITLKTGESLAIVGNYDS